MKNIIGGNRRGGGKTLNYLLASIFAVVGAMSAQAADRTISANYNLSGDETVDGVLTVASGVTVDLKGRYLAVKGLAGDGTITSSLAYSSDLTSPDTTQTRVTWVTKFGTGNDVANGNLRDNTTTPRNLFNDSALAAETNDNNKRILVTNANLPLAVTYDFGEGTPKKVTKYRLYMTRTNTSNTGRGPNVWTFEGSNDNENWTLLDSRSSITWKAYNASSNPYKEYAIGNGASYRYYRIKFTSSSDSSYLELNRLEYFSTPELRVAVADGDSVTNSTVSIAGSVKVVKEGEGEFAEAKAGQTYTGGMVLAEGTYALAGTASLDWTKFTLGTDPAKPVTLRVGENVTLSNISESMIVGSNITATVYKDGGSWSISGALFLNYLGSSTNVFNHNGGEIVAGRLAIPRTGSGEFNMNSGTVTVGSDGTVFGSSSVGDHALLNLNGGEFATPFLKYHNGASGKTATVRFNGGTLKIIGTGAMAMGDTPSGGTDYSNVANLQNVLLFKVAAGGGTIDMATHDVTMPLAISEDAESTGGGMTFKGGGSMTLDATPAYTGGTTVEAGTMLAVTSQASVDAVLNDAGLTVAVTSNLVFAVTVFSTSSGTISAAQLANCTLSGAYANGYWLALGANSQSIVLQPLYVWGDGGSGSDWKASDVWEYGGAAASWTDGARAAFNADGDSVTVGANVAADWVYFHENATVVANDGTLSATNVFVATGKTGAINAQTEGPLVKTGEGTLTLGLSRTDDTTLSEGTLKLSDAATLDWTKFTFGTDPANPVTLRIGENATLNNIPASWYVGNISSITSTVYKTGGDWNLGELTVGGRASGAVTKFYHTGGSMAMSTYLVVCNGTSTSSHADYGYFEISGGSVTNTVADADRVYIGNYGEGKMVVKSGGEYVSKSSLVIGNYAGSQGTLDIDDGGTVTVAKAIVFNYNSADSAGIVNLRSGGVLSAERIYRNKDGSATFNFDGGKLVITSNIEANKLFSKQAGGGAVTVTVSENGGTIDNGGNANSSAIGNTITGDGGLTLIGSGTTRIFANQAYTGTTLVKSGTTLSVNGVSFAGPVAFESGSTLNIASYTAGVVPLSPSALTLPAEGVVGLKYNGGAFPAGIYAICSVAGVTVADGAKFEPTRGGKTASWSVVGNTLLLAVGTSFGNNWTGLAGDGKMSSNGNWADCTAPIDGEDVDFSGVTVSTMINADIANATFGAVTMGSGPVVFTNANMAAKSFSDTSKVAVAANSTVTLDGDLEFGTNVESYVCRYIYEGGKFVVTGKIIATKKQTGALYPHWANNTPGSISAKGLVNNAASDLFYLVQKDNDRRANWQIGEDGISGAKRYTVGHSGGGTVTIKATADFSVSADIIQKHNLVLEPDGHEITLGTNVAVHAGGILGGEANGLTTVTGPGKVVANYNVANLTSYANSQINAFTVADGGTLAIVPGANPCVSANANGKLTVNDGATLKVAESGTVTLGGDLTLSGGACLGFNFTERANAPKLAIADGKTMTASDNVKVKLSGVWPRSGDYQLTSGGGFDAEGVNVSLDETSKPEWADDISVNKDGNIVISVKPKGLVFMVN